MTLLSVTLLILLFFLVILIIIGFSIYKNSILLKEIGVREEKLKVDLETLAQKLSDILVTVEKTKLESQFESSSTNNVAVIGDFKSGVKSLISFIGDPVVVAQIVNTVTVGVTLFIVAYCLARYIHSEHVQTVVTNLYAGFLNTTKVTEHVSADGDETRQVLSAMSIDISSTASHINKHTSNVSDESTLTLLKDIDEKTISVTNLISENASLLAGEAPKVCEKLVEIQTCLDVIKADLNLLHLKVDKITDAVTFVSESESNLEQLSTLMSICT